MAHSLSENPRQGDGQGESSRSAPRAGSAGGLLESKLRPPPVRHGSVARDGLIRLLDRTRLVLISAPAGYGKTTLLAQWCATASGERSFAWVSLGYEDNDPDALWRLVLHSLQRARPTRLGESLLQQAVQAPYAGVTGDFLTGLVSVLAALPGRVAIVLDDYHMISEPACHEQLEFLLGHLPPHAQVVLSGRAKPPLRLAGLRAGGDLTEIGMRELRFTSTEIALVIRAVSGIELSELDLNVLTHRTEGWPTGVYLAALSLRGAHNPSLVVRRFTGSHRYIGDFLAEEVINQQPDHIRHFLLQTSVLDSFTASLCEAVTGAADAREIIDQLENQNVFLVPLDDRREWFRYHHLFAQVLRNELARAEPDILPLLHRRASAWHQRSGGTVYAVRHALAAGDTDAAVTLVAERWLGLMDTGQISTVRVWLRSLGDERVSAHPLAVHCAAWAAAFSDERESFRRWLSVLETSKYAGPLPDGTRSLESSVALLDGTFGLRGLAMMRKAAAKAVSLENDASSPWYAQARAAHGTALYFTGDYAAARKRLDEALLGEPRIARVRLLAATFRCLVALDEDRLGQAEALADIAEEIVADHAFGLARAPQGAFAGLAAGAVHARNGHLEEARGALEHGLQLRRRWPGISPWPNLEIMLRLAPVLRDLGDAAGAADLLAESRDILTAFPDGAEAQFDRLEQLHRRLIAPEQEDSPVEPLTVREEAVLRLLPEALSAREIAQELYVSVNTVKSQIRAIYRKLGVSSRQAAITRGRDLGML
jgi:ATP/maltotriose-dependent transcriptional regulator MalT